MISPFQMASLPQIHFGWDCRHTFLQQLNDRTYQHLILIVSPFQMQDTQFGQQLVEQLQQNGCRLQIFTVSGEPSPDLVDEIVQNSSQKNQAVIGLGGGSVLDTAKAVAGLVPSQRSVMDYLEGVGKGLTFEETTLPFIALPTTAGTGSETTKNAVLSRLGEFKKSFRSDKLLAQEVWLDPAFLPTCPKPILYSTGLDAFTQLLESYTTPKANPVTDALAWQGMTLFKNAFEMIQSDDLATQKTGYGNLMLAASLSGITLANAGLGAVHGLAGPIGAHFKAPHGAVCALLLAPITQQNLQRLAQCKDATAQITLKKYVQVAALMTDQPDQIALLNYLKKLAQNFIPQQLKDYGIVRETLDPILASCRSGSMLGNPVILSDEQLIAAMIPE